jgi:soluble lytic murein transglycosylase
MTVFTRVSRHLLFSAALCTPLLAQASEQNDLLMAQDAYRANDMQRLARIAGGMKTGILQVYPNYWLTLKALDQNNDAQVAHFLDQAPASAMTEQIRREWLKRLGKREAWSQFEAEWNKLPREGRDEESQCYGELQALRMGRSPENLDRFLEARQLPEGCNTLIRTARTRGLLSQEWLWKRFRLLLSANLVSQARQLSGDNGLGFDSALINNPSRIDPATRQGQEAMLFNIESTARSNLQTAASHLSQQEAQMGKSAAGFAWGQLAVQAARKLQTADALQWYARADRSQLNNDQWEWWARCQLRTGQWNALLQVLQAMPASLSAAPAWSYWQARALRALNRSNEANVLLARTSQDRGFYGLLAQEELGRAVAAAPDKNAPNDADITLVKNDPAIQRSLALYNISQTATRPVLRTAAQVEWRWAMRNRSDMQLLAASELARQAGFYDMAIYSAERTRNQHDFSLRYLTPYHDVTQRYARQLDIDEAWVYGLIRQESRFITVARSGVGASGLMQIMPKTARWVAQKMGLSNALATNDIETNIQLGTWYLKYVLDSLSGNPVLATAAYNAGPSRARAWQMATPMEGVAYAETIPFRETRDYVQKVMANAAYYASAMGHNNLSLKARMGTIPARNR